MKVNFYNINLEIRHEILVQLEYTITSIHYNESETVTDSRLFKCSPVFLEKMIPRLIPILQDQLDIVDDIRRLSVF